MGYVDSGMPSWDDIFSPVEIQGLAMYVLETRANVGYVTSNYDAPLSIPEGEFETELHSFRLETLVDDLDPLPFSLAPLPDGSLLVTEKTKGVRVISPDGDRSELIRGTPQAYDDIYQMESRIDIERGMGWLFDILLHPNYERERLDLPIPRSPLRGLHRAQPGAGAPGFHEQAGARQSRQW